MVKDFLPDDTYHTSVIINSQGKDVYFSLAELPQKKPFEMMAFPVDKSGKPDFGTELFCERYSDKTEALKRYIDVVRKVQRGYDFQEIPPKGFQMDVVDKPMTFEGIKLNPYDVIGKTEEGKALLIARCGEPKGRISYDRTASPDKEQSWDGFVKFPGEREIWKAHDLDEWNFPVKAMQREAIIHYDEKQLEAVKKNVEEKKEDCINLKEEFAFTKSVGKDIVVDFYSPLGKEQGIYHHQEKTYDKEGLKKVVEMGPTAMPWDEYKKRCKEEFTHIEEAKKQKILYLPGNTTIQMPNKVAQMEKDPTLHTRPVHEKRKKLGLQRASSGKGLER